jgi:choline dehydrogenase
VNESSAEFAQAVKTNQKRLCANLRPHYDFIVYGSGSSGSVVARRLAEDANVSVLLLEAGADDDDPGVTEAGSWRSNLGSVRDWGFVAAPCPHLNGRSVPLSMGKVLGGGSSINVMIWSRGHKSDWDFFASEAQDQAWSYRSVLDIYRRIEDWHGAPDPDYRGTGVSFSSSPRRTPTRWLRQCWTDVDRGAFRSSRTRTVE